MAAMNDLIREVTEELERVGTLGLSERVLALEALQIRLRTALDEPASA